MSGEDDVDDLRDGRLDGQGVVLAPATPGPGQHWPPWGWIESSQFITPLHPRSEALITFTNVGNIY